MIAAKTALIVTTTRNLMEKLVVMIVAVSAIITAQTINITWNLKKMKKLTKYLIPNLKIRMEKSNRTKIILRRTKDVRRIRI